MLKMSKLPEREVAMITDVKIGDTFKTWNDRILLVTAKCHGTYCGDEMYAIIELSDSTILEVFDTKDEYHNRQSVIGTLNRLKAEPCDVHCEAMRCSEEEKKVIMMGDVAIEIDKEELYNEEIHKEDVNSTPWEEQPTTFKVNRDDMPY